MVYTVEVGYHPTEIYIFFWRIAILMMINSRVKRTMVGYKYAPLYRLKLLLLLLSLKKINKYLI